MENILLSTINEIETDLSKANIAPGHAMMIEIRKRINFKLDQEIDNLVKEGKIKTHHTINDRFIKIVE